MPARIFLPRLQFVSSGFVPPGKANLVYWFDASTISGSDGDLLSQWNDLSGNSNHATKGAGSNSNRPILKKNIVNGRAVVRFNAGGGTTNYFDLPSAMGSPVAGEMFVIAKADADPSAAAAAVGMVTLCGSGAVGSQAWPFTDGKLYETFGSNLNDHTLIVKTPNVATGFHLHHVVAEDKHYPVRLDGEIYHDAGVNTVSFANTHRHIGSDNAGTSNFWRGDIAEILVYKTALTAAQRQQIYVYLALKYGLTVTTANPTITPATYSGLQIWYKADSLGLSDGASVSSWTDQSGNGRDLSQAVALTQPVFKSAGLNSRNSVRFTITQNLGLASAFSIASGGAYSILAVGQYTADCSIIGHTTDNNQVRVRRGGINQTSSFVNGGSEAISTTFARAIGDPFLGTWRRNTSNQHSPVLSNGDLNGNGTITTAAAWRMTTLGGGSAGINLAGDISEFCLYNTLLTNQQMWNLFEYYFRSRWGLP